MRRLRAIASVLVLLAFGAVGFRYRGELDRLLRADPACVAALAALVVAVRWTAAEIMRDTLAQVGHPLRRGDIFGLSALSSVPALFFPRAGFGALGMGLRARHGVPFSASTALVLPLSVLDLVVVGAGGLALQGWLFLASRPYEPALAAVFAATLVAALVALFLNPRLPFAPARLARFLDALADAWRRLRGNRPYVLRMLALLTLITALRVARLALAYRAIGFAPSLDGLVLASLLGDLMFMLAITPGALGLREAAIVYGARMAGVTPEASLAAALLDRMAMMLVVLLLAQGAAWRLFGSRERR
jgi:glycosyltransferase 2 family protein